MKVYGEWKVLNHPFLNSVLDVEEWLALRTGRCTRGDEPQYAI
jgi:hypothetical protein